MTGCAVLASDAAPVSQQDLVAPYADYSGKQVVVRGEVVSGPEMTVMWLPGDSGTQEGMVVALSEETSKKHRVAPMGTSELLSVPTSD